MNDLEVKEQKNYGRGIGKVREKDKREKNLVLAEGVFKLGIQEEQLLE